MHFSGAGKAWEVFKNTFPAPRKSIFTHFSGAGEVLIYTYLAPERPEKPEKPEKYLYIPHPKNFLFVLVIVVFSIIVLYSSNHQYVHRNSNAKIFLHTFYPVS